jgi:hypothetical protein
MATMWPSGQVAEGWNDGVATAVAWCIGVEIWRVTMASIWANVPGHTLVVDREAACQ